MVYGLGKAQLAFNLGHKIDVQTYNASNGVLNKLGLKPWNLPAKEDILAMLTDEKERAIIAYRFSEEAETAIAHATEMKEKYFGQFPDIQVFIKNCTNLAKKRGWVKTWSGRKRHFKNAYKEGYKGPNAVIQGGCGDIIKVKIHEVTEFLRPYQSRIVNNIHDALLFEIHETELHLVPQIKAIMETLPFSVPITCGVETSAKSWAELEKEVT